MIEVVIDPSNWIKKQDNLFLHTIVAFAWIHGNIYDFTSLAELDLRVYNAPQSETFAKQNTDQINTRGQVIVIHVKLNFEHNAALALENSSLVSVKEKKSE
jgi:hypothetical protein